MIEKNKLIQAIKSACDWLCDIAMIKTNILPANTGNRKKYPYKKWRGCIKTDYHAASKQWNFMGPVWHTGQAMDALVTAGKLLKNQNYINAAEICGEFIFDKQIYDCDHQDYGLILAYEDLSDKVNTSAILECLHGPVALANLVNSEEIWNRIIAAANFVIDKMYSKQQRVFVDVYDPVEHKHHQPSPFHGKGNANGRPLLEAGVLTKIFRKTGDEKFLNTHLEISERLLTDQNPSGNWMDYSPNDPVKKSFHPRHTYWWGIPLIESFRITHDARYIEAATACAEFTVRALRHDGGYFRNYYLGNSTDSFGHATSGSACAAILLLELLAVDNNTRWISFIEDALSFCMNMQFSKPQDENLRGAILEKILPPDGTDNSPYYLRDLGSIFFIKAASLYIENFHNT